MDENRQSNIIYYLLSSLVAIIYSLFNANSVEGFLIQFIVPFAAATVIAIPIQVISPKASWPKILFWSMLILSVMALFGGISANGYVD